MKFRVHTWGKTEYLSKTESWIRQRSNICKFKNMSTLIDIYISIYVIKLNRVSTDLSYCLRWLFVYEDRCKDPYGKQYLPIVSLTALGLHQSRWSRVRHSRLNSSVGLSLLLSLDLQLAWSKCCDQLTYDGRREHVLARKERDQKRPTSRHNQMTNNGV